MVVQHNLPAMNSHRQMGINNSQTSSNLEKLSSGYRINRAGDDAAGLAISEKMRGQIRGLDMATTNAENGVSLIQTAEGGLNETHSILQRMRELAVQSANGTYADEVDRENIDKEVQALKSEIDRISSSTHYNGINLLDGSLGGQTVEAMANAATRSGGAVASPIAALGSIGLASGGTAGSLTLKDASLNGQVAKIVVSAGATISGTQTASAAVISLQIGDESFSLYVKVDSTTGAETITDDFVRVNADGSTTAVASLNTGGGAAFAAATVEGSGVVTIKDLTTDPLANNATKAFDYADNVISTGKSQLIFQIGANGGADQRVGLHVDNMSTGHLGDPTSKNVYLEGTRVKNVDVSTRDKANESINILDKSINQVSGTRADLGALQNRLEHTINNLGVTKENLQAAESSIRDVDMAKEMMEFTKNNILVQASQSMLAQANQLPQGVLNLLR